jgi:hypothetical protein
MSGVSVTLSYRLPNLIGKLAQMLRKPVEHFPLCVVRCEVPDQGGLGRIFAELFQTGLIILQGKFLSVIERAPEARSSPKVIFCG